MFGNYVGGTEKIISIGLKYKSFFIIKGFWTIVFMSIFISTTIYPPAFFRYLSNMELRLLLNPQDHLFWFR